jgi:hypothetical protein
MMIFRFFQSGTPTNKDAGCSGTTTPSGKPKSTSAYGGASDNQSSYSNAIHNLINNPNVKVKIADLGNACYEVRQLSPFSVAL